MDSRLNGFFGCPFTGGSNMANNYKDQGIALLQKNPSRELLLEKMRLKLATTPPPAMEKEVRKRDVRKKKTLSWTVRGAILLAIIGSNYFLIGHKDTIVAKLGFEAVSSLPAPKESLGPDEKALYWTYAMYDIGKLRARFGVSGYYAINPIIARRGLEAVLPMVTSETLNEISAYLPVAYKTIKAGNPE
ncbi:MAG: hypothetical protein JWP91_47 [Fibrobacteres bacterium]|nr:hypothetical protein [Fibrobacterota bacterium]